MRTAFQSKEVQTNVMWFRELIRLAVWVIRPIMRETVEGLGDGGVKVKSEYICGAGNEAYAWSLICFRKGEASWTTMQRILWNRVYVRNSLLSAANWQRPSYIPHRLPLEMSLCKCMRWGAYTETDTCNAQRAVSVSRDWLREPSRVALRNLTSPPVYAKFRTEDGLAAVDMRRVWGYDSFSQELASSWPAPTGTVSPDQNRKCFWHSEASNYWCSEIFEASSRCDWGKLHKPSFFAGRVWAGRGTYS